METITLQTPWRRGDGERCKEPGLYLIRSFKDRWCLCASRINASDMMYHSNEYAGPLEIIAPEPMPELVQVEGCSVEIRVGPCFSIVDAMLPSGELMIKIRDPDERTARLAFNDAAKRINDAVAAKVGGKG